MFVIAALAFLLPSVTFADTVGLKLSPTIIEDNAEPGTTLSGVLHVQNLSSVESKLYPIARNISGIGADQHPVYSLGKNDGDYELASWITYEEPLLIVQPGGTRDLHFVVHFPKDASPGSHMAGLFLSEKSSKDVKEGSLISFEVGAILHYRMAGEIIDDTRIREFFSAKTIYGTPDVPFTLRLENLGNTLARPRGIIDITNMFGKKVASLTVNDEAAGLFPKTTKEFKITWHSDELQFGRYEAIVALSVEGAQGNQTISRVLQFWILPIHIFMPALGGFLAFILFVYVLLRLYVRSQLRGVRSISRGTSRSAVGLSRLAAVVIGLLVAVIIGLIILFFYFG